MTSKLVVNTIEADTGISSVSFASSISMSSTSKFFFSDAGIDIGADTNINRPTAGALGFNINSSEKVRITSAGNVGIGTAVPESASNYANLSLADTTGGQIELKRLSDDTKHYIWGNQNLNIAGGYANGASSSIRFYVNGANERLRITSGGTALFGTTASVNSLRAVFQGYSDGGENFQARIRFQTNQATNLTSGSHIANLLFTNASGSEGARIDVKADANWGTGSYPSRIEFLTTASSANTPTERLRITNTGQLLLGSTSSANSGYKFESYSGGAYNIMAKSTNGNGGYHNFTGQASNGTITSYITHNGRGYFEDGVQFDSGGEVLDSYEEGTWTPNMFGNGSGSYTTRNGYFTKIGDTVNIYFYIDVTNANAGGGNKFLMYGLPFTSTGRATGSFMSKYHTTNNNRWYVLYIDTNSSHIQSWGSESSQNWEALGADGTFEMIGQITYRTNS